MTRVDPAECDHELHCCDDLPGGDMSLTLCVLLWAREGRENALIDYEDRVLELVPAHGGRVVQRARSSGAAGEPLEVQTLEFPSQAALDDYVGDERRAALAAARDDAIARTDILKVDLV
jgi:uncharacterized protein (DUF1330 family)